MGINDKEKIKNMLPILEAYSNGKTIQYRDNYGEWGDIEEDIFLDTLAKSPQDYRIKPSPKYRPFANAEECWQEILKHQPVGWVKSISDETLIQSILLISREGITLVLNSDNFCVMFDTYTFVDGTIFGTKEESEG